MYLIIINNLLTLSQTSYFPSVYTYYIISNVNLLLFILQLFNNKNKNV